MDPTGGKALWVAAFIVVAVIISFFFLPSKWAIVLAVALATVFIGGLLYILANTRFT
jgi:hypothetical protein